MSTSIHKCEDRFGYRSRGEFRCTRKSETLLLGLLAGGYALLVALTIMCALVCASLLDVVVIVAMIVGVIPLFTIIGVVLLRVIIYGNGYTYNADSEKMMITDHKGYSNVFYYKDVMYVTYEPLTLFTGVRGYHVRITDKKNRCVKYNYIFSKNKLLRTPEGSPFFIIEERAGTKSSEIIDFV